MIELLVVIAIIAILSAIGFVAYSGINARARDAVRLSDFSNIKQAIILATHDAQDLSSVLCSKTNTPCSGLTYPLEDNSLNTYGTGWIKVDFDLKNYANFDHLPVDPVNNVAHNYSYYSDGINWKIETVFESEQFKEYMENDYGTSPNKYEVFSKSYEIK